MVKAVLNRVVTYFIMLFCLNSFLDRRLLMINFMNSFFTYALIFVVSIICVTIAVKLGVAWRKSSDLKNAGAAASDSAEVQKK